jgi:polyhydroxyalkanoate synthesis regulator phasin
MKYSTEKLGQWIDQFINMGKLSYHEKINFFDELIQYYADPSLEEYEKCRSLKKMNELLEKRIDGEKMDMAEVQKVAVEATEIIYYLISSIQTEINERVNSLKKALTTNGK